MPPVGWVHWLTMAAGLQASLGPLVSPQGQPGVCSAFLVRQQDTAVLFTAAHCLKSGQTRLWLPGLEGNALQLKESRWSTVHALPSASWQIHSWQDLAWRPSPEGAPAWEVGPMPALGAALTVMGYPEGRGPYALACRYVGIALLDDAGHPRPRPSLDCPLTGSEPFRRHTGFSGGVVMDSQNRAIGVLVSGSAMASGRIRPAFEPILPWLKEGASRYPVALPWETPEQHQVELMVRQGKIVRYAIRSPSGVVWSHWPVLQAAKAADRLP